MFNEYFKYDEFAELDISSIIISMTINCEVKLIVK